MSKIANVGIEKNVCKEVSLQTIKRKVKELVPEDFPVLYKDKFNKTYWFYSAKHYTSLSSDIELLNNLKEFFILDLDYKKLNDIYIIQKSNYEENGKINTIYSGCYEIPCACGTMHFGLNINTDAMVSKIDNHIAKYYN
jgi:hypothetical protein